VLMGGNGAVNQHSPSACAVYSARRVWRLGMRRLQLVVNLQKTSDLLLNNPSCMENVVSGIRARVSGHYFVIYHPIQKAELSLYGRSSFQIDQRS
jgi:hypothetical protein